MKNNPDTDFEHALLSGVDTVKRGYSALIKNCGKMVAALTALIVILVTFTEIGFYEIGAKELTANLLLILVASYVIYFSLEDAGEALGRESKEYIAVAERLTLLCDGVKAEMIGDLQKFIEKYVNEELRHRKEALLSLNGKTLSDYEGYLSGGSVTKKDKRLFRRVGRLSAVRLGVGTLLSTKKGSSAELKNPRGPKLIGLCVRLIPTTVCTVFTASVVLGVKDGLGAAEVIEGLLRLCPLPAFALRGYSQGYSYVCEREIEWMKVKCRLLEAFMRTQCNA
ncbi:MAG: hypothetical protein IKL79_03275 [Clostridia bacterium]|nr:hypothetical protein [Clostridia bacterium]